MDFNKYRVGELVIYFKKMRDELERLKYDVISNPEYESSLKDPRCDFIKEVNIDELDAMIATFSNVYDKGKHYIWEVIEETVSDWKKGSRDAESLFLNLYSYRNLIINEYADKFTLLVVPVLECSKEFIEEYDFICDAVLFSLGGVDPNEDIEFWTKVAKSRGFTDADCKKLVDFKTFYRNSVTIVDSHTGIAYSNDSNDHSDSDNELNDKALFELNVCGQTMSMWKRSLQKEDNNE